MPDPVSLSHNVSAPTSQLDRIETTLVKMRERLESLARLEERVEHHAGQIEKVWTAITDQDGRVRDVEAVADNNSNVARWAERILWLTVVAALEAGKWIP